MLNHEEILVSLNQAWSWTEVKASRILLVNVFGNIIFHGVDSKYYRICPEELSCELIASTNAEFESLKKELDFWEDWNMDVLRKSAEEKMGSLGIGQKYCLKVPAVIGGEYSEENLGKVDFKELIAFSGDLANQISDLEDGDKYVIKVK